MNKALFCIVVSSALLTACGTTSGLKTTVPQKEESNQQAESKRPLLSGYDRVVVNDIEDNDESALKNAGKRFSDRIALELKKTGEFKTVSRQPLDGHAVVIDGEITHYDDGNQVARLMIGFGAGSSNLDAIITTTDNETGRNVNLPVLVPG